MEADTSEVARIFLGYSVPAADRRRATRIPLESGTNRRCRGQPAPEFTDRDAERTNHMEPEADIEQALRRHAALSHRDQDRDRHDDGPKPNTSGMPKSDQIRRARGSGQDKPRRRP